MFGVINHKKVSMLQPNNGKIASSTSEFLSGK